MSFGSKSALVQELLKEDLSLLRDCASLDEPWGTQEQLVVRSKSQKFAALSLNKRTDNVVPKPPVHSSKINNSHSFKRDTVDKSNVNLFPTTSKRTDNVLPKPQAHSSSINDSHSPKRHKMDKPNANLSPITAPKNNVGAKFGPHIPNSNENETNPVQEQISTLTGATATSKEFDAFESYLKNGLPKAKSDAKCRLSQLSQFFKNSQVLEQIESITLQHNTEFKKPYSKEQHIPNEEMASTSVFEESCREEFGKFFDHVRHSISAMGTSVELQDQKISQVIDILCQADDADKAQNDLVSDQSLAHIDWSGQILTNGSVNSSFGAAVRQALLANANKTVVSSNLNSSLVTQNKIVFNRMGPFYDLPVKVKELIHLYRGIDKLYDWQDECLNLPSVKARKNLIYALPTSGGKTLVAEILMLRELLCYNQNALFILPYVAIVQEKVWALSPFAVDLDFLIEEYAASKGSYPPRKRRRKKSIYIATIEKALGLINSLIETERINELGLIVVDELHLVGEQGRGATLEGLLIKIKYINAGIHVVGMSATIGNVDELCKFLDAEVYTQNFRPVELIEHVKCGSEIAKVNWSSKEEELLTVVRNTNFDYSDALEKLDPDRLGGLVMEVIPDGSCLIFCHSKKNCENVAYLLCKVCDRNLLEHRKEEKQQVKNALKDEGGSLCKIFNVSIQYGIAYHHSGLTNDERKVIEDAFRAGIISVICCTSTLAAGVNLPAKRVILRQPYIGRDFISLSRYKQMVGRAGRAGLGETGDSILICSTLDLPKVKNLLLSPMDKALSNMHQDEGRGLRHMLLSFISLGLANTRPQLQDVTKSTLLAIQSERFDVDSKKLTDRVLCDLFRLGALQDDCTNDNDSPMCNVSVRMDTSSTTLSGSSDNSEASNRSNKKRIKITNNTKLVISKLGSAAIKGNFELSRAHLLYDDLYQAQKSLVLLNVLHLLYLVTPYETAEHVRPNKQLYYNIFCKLEPKEMHTANILGLNDSVALKLLSNKKIKSLPERVLNRFYLTLILYDLWQERPVFEVSEKFQVDRGVVQNLMTGAATFASNVVHFCEALDEFWMFAYLIKGMGQKLSHCCVRELLPLMELPSVKLNRARQLYNSGFKTIQSIAKANVDALMENIEFMSIRVAKQLIAAAKMLLLEKVENLREDAEDVLEGVDIPKQTNQSVMFS